MSAYFILYFTCHTVSHIFVSADELPLSDCCFSPIHCICMLCIYARAYPIGSRNTAVQILPTRRYATLGTGCGPVSVCPSVRHKSVFYRNGCTDRAGFWHVSIDHITPILQSLHWQKITERIEYKLLSLTYKVLTTTQPSYLHNLITVQPPRSTRSSSLVTLASPSTSSSLRITDRSFQYASLSSLKSTPVSPPSTPH